MYAEGLAQIGRYQEAQRAVAEAIRTAHDTPNAPYPSMAESTKVEILTQTGKYVEAFKTLDESEAWASSHHLEGHLCAAEINRGDLWNRAGKTDLAIVSYRRALEYADHLSSGAASHRQEVRWQRPSQAKGISRAPRQRLYQIDAGRCFFDRPVSL